MGGISLLMSPKVKAQLSWCQPTVINYGSTTPGITRVKFNEIDRNSATLEDYIYTRQLATIRRGSSGSITITYTMDEGICPNMNIRIWVDLNQNGVFEEPSELLVSKNKDFKYTYTSNLSVPLTAKFGVTRMRVAVKMSDDGGHTNPTPCNVPADPLQWHGEIEDYDLKILGATGEEELAAESVPMVSVYPNPAHDNLNVEFEKEINGRGTLSVLDLSGRTILEKDTPEGIRQQTIDIGAFGAGLYFLKINGTTQSRILKFFIE